MFANPNGWPIVDLCKRHSHSDPHRNAPMNAPKAPVPPMSGKTDGELLSLIASPADWPPEAIDAAKIELWKRQVDTPAPQPPQLSSLAVYSLFLFLLPYVGLPMAIAALRRIARSEERLYGRKLAWAAVAVNTLSLLVMLAGIVLTVILTMLGR